MLGGIGGVGLALLRDRLDHVFHDPLELRSALPLPLLGVIPFFNWPKGLSISEALESMESGKHFEIRESLRNLYTNFRLLRADKTVRLVALTSSTQGEGKSSTSVLFARTLAQLGQKVLLVDADMRRPMLHRYLGTENAEGLSSLITNPSLSLPHLIRNLDDNLDLITAGPTPPDTTQLLSSSRSRAVVNAIRSLPGYDLVIFDTPPAYLLSDAVLLAEHLDGLLFVVGIDCVSRDLPAQALERIRDTGVDILGLLASHPVNERNRKIAYGYNYFLYGYSGYQKMVGRYVDSRTDASPMSNARKSDSKSRPQKLQQIMSWLDKRG